MLEAVYRHRLMVIIIGLLLLGLLIWFFISMNARNKIPSKGVFVRNSIIMKYAGR